MSKNTVNLFFACDERYLPFFGVALTSIKKHADPHRFYRVILLHTDIPATVEKEVCHTLGGENFSVGFRNVSRELSAFRDRLHTRDYYSNATYFRLLIPALYPKMKKALYLDSDILLRTDVAALFDTPIDGFLAAAVPDGFVNQVPVLRKYVENRVGVPACMPYFNAGVLLMNLDEMRKIRFGELFVSLLSRVTFRVAQDQDYLNVICRGRVKFLSEEWNYMPFGYAEKSPALVHFNLDMKPWQRDDIPYGDEFWACADATPFAAALRERRASYSEADARRAAEGTEKVVATAVAESEDAEECRRTAARIRRVMSEAGNDAAAPALRVAFVPPMPALGREGSALL